MERVLKREGSSNAANSGRVAQCKSIRPAAQGEAASRFDRSPLMVAQRKKLQSLFGGAAQLREETVVKPNNTGLPDNLKSGIENLSGMSMDHVKVHYNSSKPAQLNALAYAQGSDIHVAPGQEKHLPHEAWHVVQQARGRVKPTTQMKGGVAVNDDKSLESDADAMGVRAAQMRAATAATSASSASLVHAVIQRAKIETDRLNVAGEDHDESGKRRNDERLFALQKTCSDGYWEEREFRVTVSPEEGITGEIDADTLSHRWLNLVAFIFKTKLDSISNIEDVVRHVGNLSYVHERLKNQTEIEQMCIDHQCNHVKVSEILGQEDFIKAVNAIARSLRAKVDSEEGKLPDVSEEDYALFDESLKLPSHLKLESGSTLDRIVLERSMLMAKAAQQHCKRPGIWKIGDFHVQEIKDSYKALLAFNLLTRKEFNELYEAWWQERSNPHLEDESSHEGPPQDQQVVNEEQQFFHYRGFPSKPSRTHWRDETSQWRPSNEYKKTGGKKRKLEKGSDDDEPVKWPRGNNIN